MFSPRMIGVTTAVILVLGLPLLRGATPTQETEVEQLRVEVKRLQGEVEKLSKEVQSMRLLLPQMERKAAATNAAQQVAPVPTVTREESKSLRLRDVLIRIDALARPYQDSTTTVQKDESLGRILPAISDFMQQVAFVSVTATVRDVAIGKDGVVEIRIAVPEDINYDDQASRALHCRPAMEWRVRMPGELAAKLRPGTAVVISGKPKFDSKANYSVLGPRNAQNIITICMASASPLIGSISMEEYQVQIGQLSFASPYGQQK